jgi:hypothetical protein
MSAATVANPFFLPIAPYPFHSLTLHPFLSLLFEAIRQMAEKRWV